MEIGKIKGVAQPELGGLKVKKNNPQIYQQWIRVVLKQMSHLSKPQAIVLGMWSDRDRHDS